MQNAFTRFVLAVAPGVIAIPASRVVPLTTRIYTARYSSRACRGHNNILRLSAQLLGAVKISMIEVVNVTRWMLQTGHTLRDYVKITALNRDQ